MGEACLLFKALNGPTLKVGLRRIQHGLRWRWRYACDLLRFYFRVHRVRLQLALLWHAPHRPRPHRLPGVLVVSLTSYPPRFGTLALTLRSLLRQRIKPDHLILWIASGDFPLLPLSVIGLQAYGLKIRLTEDLKSYKKIIPALDQFPEAFIATADDDLFYWPSWLEELAAGVEPLARVIPCHRAHEIVIDELGRYRPYRQWVQDTPMRGKSFALFPTGMGGILYPPGVLHHTPEDREGASKFCPSGDDIWLYWMARRNGATYKTVGRYRVMEPWPGSQDRALWHHNVLEDANDLQIVKMAQCYGYPEITRVKTRRNAEFQGIDQEYSHSG
jgi:hypothetical protein